MGDCSRLSFHQLSPPPPLPTPPAAGTRFTNLDWGFPATGRLRGRWAESGEELRSVFLGGQSSWVLGPDSCNLPPERFTSTPNYPENLTEAVCSSSYSCMPSLTLSSEPRQYHGQRIRAFLGGLLPLSECSGRLRGDQGHRRQRSTAARASSGQ